MVKSDRPSVLITGGAGFIGRATGDLLVKNGWHVIALDILDPQVHEEAPILPQGVELVRGDVRDRTLLATLLGRVDSVLHLAARTGVGQSMYAIGDYVDTNVGGTAVLLDELVTAKHGIKKLVVASSRAVYGEGAALCANCGTCYPKVRGVGQLDSAEWDLKCEKCKRTVEAIPTAEDKPMMPACIYAISKRDQEELCLCVGKAHQIETVALRYFNVYGAGQPSSNPYTGIIPVFAAQVLSGRAAEVYEDGEPLRDFVHVDDVARANVLALENRYGRSFVANVGSAEPISILQAARVVSKALGGVHTPKISGKYRVGDIRQCYADLTFTRSMMGFEPKINFAQGISSMFDQLRSEFRGDFSGKAASELAAHGLSGTAVPERQHL